MAIRSSILNTSKTLLIIVFVFLFHGYVWSQSAWKLSIEKEGIKIYTQQLADSKVNAIKVDCEVKSTQSQLVALLMDVNSSAQWLYHTKSSILIKRVSPSELYYYSEISLPWPANNRDFVAHLTVSQNPVTKVVTIDGPAVPGIVPEKKGVVRISNSTGKWTITPNGPNQVKVEYILHVEPGGNIPAWMANVFATEGPLQIFKKLKVQVQKPVYKSAGLAFIDEKEYVAN